MLFRSFSGLNKKPLENTFRRIRSLLILISIPVFIFTFLLAPYIIKIVYGQAYLESTIILRILSILLITAPLAGIYNTYLVSRKKTQILAVLLIGTTLINIALNYIFIIYGLHFGMIYALIGASTATVISRVIYLFGMVIYKKLAP